MTTRRRGANPGPVPIRILVTGANGFLGGAVVRRLLELPDIERIIGLDLDDGDADDDRYVSVNRDITDGVADLLDVHRIEAIVHHAFVIQPPRRPESAREVNVEATARLLSDARAAGVARIVYPSSTTVYGAWAGAGPHREDETPRPLPGFVYSEHKVEAERAMQAMPGAPTVVVLRGCVVAGPGATGFILDSLALPFLPVVAGADPEMQFLHIDDYTAAVEAALVAPNSGTFNIASADTLPVREMARLVGSRVVPVPERVLRSVIRWSWRLRLQSRSPEVGLAFITHPWLASIENAGRLLAWEPQRSARDAIADWAAWRRGERRRR